ncbi:MAG: adenylate/guanylate cyclase domain-containing protein [Pseudomonadota bacterium]
MMRDGFEWLKALPLLAVTATLGVLALMTLAGAQSTDAGAREHLFDFYQRLAPASYTVDAEFHVVMIDRESADQVGPWPWPRTIVADLVEAAKAAGAKGVILTEPVDAPDPLSPETIGAFWLEGASDEALARELARLPSTDTALAAAFEGAPGAVGAALTPAINPASANAFDRTDLFAADWLVAANEGAQLIALPGAQYLYAVDPALAAAAQPAVAALVSDPDGVVRRTPLLWSLKGAPAPSIALRAAQIASGAETVGVALDRSAARSQGRVVRSVTIGDEIIPLSDNTALRLYLPKRLSAPATSAARLLGPNSNSQLAGKVVFIGRDRDLGDSVSTARGDVAPAALHAIAATQILSGDAPRRPGWTGYLEALGVMLFGAAAIMIAQRLEFWPAMGFAAAASAVLVTFSFAIFSSNTLLLDPLAPSLALFVGALSVAGGRSIGGALRDDSFRGAFHDTLPEPVMARLRDDRASDILTGVYRDITVLACELRITDQDLDALENHPDDATKILAAASIDLRKTIIDAGGAADQAEGGRIFAYFNAPGDVADHVQAGCAAALRLIDNMDKINKDLETSSKTRGIQVHLAIGVAAGPCFAGPMGHGRNNRYSAIGPAVDRAAFLRSLSEYYGPAMICDEPIYKESHHQFAYLELDRIKTREAERPFSIYALIGNPFIKSSKGFRDLDDAHRALLTAYRAGDVRKAETMLAKVKQSPGAKIALFDIYEERLRAMAAKGVPENWDGVSAPGR